MSIIEKCVIIKQSMLVFCVLTRIWLNVRILLKPTNIASKTHYRFV